MLVDVTRDHTEIYFPSAASLRFLSSCLEILKTWCLISWKTSKTALKHPDTSVNLIFMNLKSGVNELAAIKKSYKKLRLTLLIISEWTNRWNVLKLKFITRYLQVSLPSTLKHHFNTSAIIKFTENTREEQTVED